MDAGTCSKTTMRFLLELDFVRQDIEVHATPGEWGSLICGSNRTGELRLFSGAPITRFLRRGTTDEAAGSVGYPTRLEHILGDISLKFICVTGA